MVSRSLASRLRNIVIKSLEDYQSLSGISSDYYCREPQMHAMAEGKFLSSLAIAYQQELISSSKYDTLLGNSLERLLEMNLSRDPEQLCWGLRFAFENTDKFEPFLVTSCIVTQGILDNRRHVEKDLVQKSLSWLAEYPYLEEVRTKFGSVKVPVFSPNTKRPITNAIARWVGVLNQASGDIRSKLTGRVSEITDWIIGLFIQPVGWGYEFKNKRIDLVHQCYILNGLLESNCDKNQLEETALKTISGFYSVNGYVDKLDIVSMTKALDLCKRSSKVSIYPVQPFWVVKHHKEARLWSYGELLVSLSRFAGCGKQNEIWETLSKRVGDHITKSLPLSPENAAGNEIYFRETMHAIHGMAELLAYLRSKRTESTAPENDDNSPAKGPLPSPPADTRKAS